ncbi:hypothetical protein ODJ79_41720 [Actinoplanes sp. KI2]|uniref:hypothetical protein n=1 Tax=Actinoplanes sp. KI2 TaxID=2983315 RepID=UPI0021D580FB|nr:hypothetical protein [Actinoplanes sp. KI2]MCU7730276.1 hypothetical protein [Actinoplanes sp. KI2]
MIAVRPGRDGMPAHWQLVHRSAAGLEVLATAPIARTPGLGWQQAVQRLRDSDGTLRVTPAMDGCFRWSLTDSAGEVIAQSPPVNGDSGSCRHAFLVARRAARTVLGGEVPEPGRSTQPNIPITDSVS